LLETAVKYKTSNTFAPLAKSMRKEVREYFYCEAEIQNKREALQKLKPHLTNLEMLPIGQLEQIAFHRQDLPDELQAIVKEYSTAKRMLLTLIQTVANDIIKQRRGVYFS